MRRAAESFVPVEQCSFFNCVFRGKACIELSFPLSHTDCFNESFRVYVFFFENASAGV